MATRIRKEIRQLTPVEVTGLTSAFLELKRRGAYDKYVQWHLDAMEATSLPGEPPYSSFRNHAHRGPAFLPWHRWFVKMLEDELRTVGSFSDGTLPYWDWTLDSANPEESPIWASNWMGGNGDPEKNDFIQDGPFSNPETWPVVFPLTEGAKEPLRRNFGRLASTLPNAQALARAMSRPHYSEPGHFGEQFQMGFCNYLEGWVTPNADSALTEPGTQLHNRVHNWIGGNMATMMSPDDPVFFLHHCFVDKIWADWQAVRGRDNYQPEEGGAWGHNLNDDMIYGPGEGDTRKRLSDVLDIAALGYEYSSSVTPQPPVSGWERRLKYNPYM
ncbi:tyrosinase family protein [Pseudomonas tructae]|uniref:Tyrosinase family protein n=1 Tax=Pseudomonas tructae TaxID=2518644 RepID=A0A411MQ34_9PSED|nr:tyrosinase family protein [Pseudomonas tructae]QBF28923.1 tyrosinase family protein [Pseudomonas tructae]